MKKVRFGLMGETRLEGPLREALSRRGYLVCGVDSRLEVSGIARGLSGCQGGIYMGWEPESGLGMEEALRQGVERMRRVCQGCGLAGVSRLLYVSSAATLGEDRGPTSYHVPGTGGVRQEVKYAMEVEAYEHIVRGLGVVLVLPTTVYGAGPGPGMDGEVEVVDARDVASTCVAALERGRPGRRYVLGGEMMEPQELPGWSGGKRRWRGRWPEHWEGSGGKVDDTWSRRELGHGSRGGEGMRQV